MVNWTGIFQLFLMHMDKTSTNTSVKPTSWIVETKENNWVYQLVMTKNYALRVVLLLSNAEQSNRDGVKKWNCNNIIKWETWTLYYYYSINLKNKTLFERPLQLLSCLVRQLHFSRLYKTISNSQTFPKENTQMTSVIHLLKMQKESTKIMKLFFNVRVLNISFCFPRCTWSFSKFVLKIIIQ